MTQPLARTGYDGRTILGQARDLVLAELAELTRSCLELLEHERQKELDTFSAHQRQAAQLLEKEWLVAEKLLFLQCDIAEIEWMSQAEGRLDVKTYREQTSGHQLEINALLDKVHRSGQLVIDKAVRATNDYVARRHVEIEQFHRRVSRVIGEQVELAFRDAASSLESALAEGAANAPAPEAPLDPDWTPPSGTARVITDSCEQAHAELRAALERAYEDYQRSAEEAHRVAADLRATDFRELLHRAEPVHESGPSAFAPIRQSAEQAFAKVLRDADTAARLVRSQVELSHRLKLDQLDLAFMTFTNFADLATAIFRNAYRTAVAFDREKRERQKVERALTDLKEILAICAVCRRIRDEDQAWRQLEDFAGRRWAALFSHGICPECFEKHYPED